MKYVIWLRAICCVEVFFLHYFAGHGMRDYMWTCSGAVPCFLLISAYIYGERPESKKCFDYKWMKKRWMSLSCVYYPFVTAVFLFYLFGSEQPLELSVEYLLSLVCLPVVWHPLPECGHLWFLTTLVVCYLMLYMLHKKMKIGIMLSRPRGILLFLFGILLVGGVFRGGIFVHVFFYVLVFYYSNKITAFAEKTPLWVLLSLLSVAYIPLSFHYQDLFYYGVYVRYYHTCIIAILTIMIAVKVCERNYVPNVIKWLSSISMPVYLVHHLFVYDNPLYISLPITLLLAVMLQEVGNRTLNVIR